MDIVTRADEDLLVALLNTTPVVDGERTDVLTGPDGPAWAREHGGPGSPKEIAGLRRVRDSLQAVVEGHAPGSGDLAERLEQVTVRPCWRDGSLTWELAVDPADRLASRALLAWAAISERSPERLRLCANHECHLFLLDRSNANRARWCSMAVCGNRVKARRHYARSRQGAGGS